MGIAPRNDQDERLHPPPTMKENPGMKRRGYGSRKRLEVDGLGRQRDR
uniref:Uncharacterized protein n=1 Tax=Candidatus Kentrum sp. DK TaxID=2126562 RepID=A0A450S263_9GAMM|nr:MAG: hypothetical protein BECKDK2373B_GA0170837_10111 [Candidatus Kentron sp. DK]